MANKGNVSAKSLANLIPVKKGQVLNPEGARAHNPYKKELKKLTSKILAEIIEVALIGNMDALKKIAEDPNTPVIQVGVARVLFSAIKNENWTLLEQVLARLMGKPTEKIDYTSNGETINSTLTVKFIPVEKSK